MPRRLPRILPVLLLAAVLTACDTNDPGGNTQIEAIVGTYAANQLTFDPTTQGIQDANALSRVASGSSVQLQLFSNQTATLSYRLAGSTQTIGLAGTFSLSGNRVTLRFDSDDEDELARLLIPLEIRLDVVSTSTLEVNQNESVDLEAYDPSTYNGLDDVDGMLVVRFVRS